MFRNQTKILVLVAAFCLGSVEVVADVAPPEPDPPHGDNPDCDVFKNYDLLGAYECETCEPLPGEGDDGVCEEEYGPQGYSFVCGSLWKEVWCCDSNDAGVCDPDAGVPSIHTPPYSSSDSDTDADGDSDSDGDKDQADAEDGDSSGCSVLVKRKRGFPAQLALVAALVGLGLFVRSRSRS